MIDEYVLHDIKLSTLPLDLSAIQIEELVLDFETRSLTLDFGSRCYLKRDASKRDIGKSHLCVIRSICEQRKEFVRDAVIQINNWLENKIRKKNTIYTIARSLVLFVDWCDKNNRSNFYQDFDSAKSAVKLYFSAIEDKVKTRQLGNNTAVNEQKNLLTFLSDYFDVDIFHSGLRLLTHDSRLIQPATVSDENSQAEVLALTNTIFWSISRFVTGFERFPLNIDMPAYLKWEDLNLWVFPNTVKFMTPEMLKKRATLKRPNWIFDYKNGRLLSKGEVLSQEGVLLSQQNFNQANNAFDRSNNDKFDTHRKSLAIIASNCFLLHFQAATGMNLTQIMDLPWKDSFIIEADIQGFRAIKARANDKEVFFRITTIFIKSFKEYLKLRKFLLTDAAEFGFLFLSFNRLGVVSRLNGNQAKVSLFNTLRKIDSNLEKITSKNWRAIKFDYLINHTDMATAALLMQNSVKTLKKHYAEGSPSKAAVEMSAFYERLSSTVSFEKSHADLVDISTGECTDYGKPLNIQIGRQVQPDCKTAEGCLFCEHYKLHADKKDIRKLLSLKFCILQTQHLSQSLEHYQLILEPVIIRIDEILNFIGGHSKQYMDIIKSVKGEVFDEGQLDSYWAKKYEILVDLGSAK